MLKKINIFLLLMVLGAILVFGCRPPEVEGVVVNIQHGLYDKAFELANEAVEKYPENAEAWFYLGYLHSRQENWVEMNRAFDKALELKPDQQVNFEGQSLPAQQAVEAIRTNHFAELYNSATANFNKARDVEDEESKRKLYETAHEKYLAASKIYPERIEPLRPLAVSSLMLGDTAQAENYLQETIERQPDNDTLKVMVADFYVTTGKLDEAEKLYSEVIQSSPNYTDAYLAMGQLETMEKNWEEAVNYFEKALELDPDNTAVAFNIAISLYNAEKYKEAVPYLKQVAEAEPENVEVHEILGISYVQAEMDQEAMPFLEQAVEKFPDNSALWNYLAIVYSRLGMKQKAEEAFNKSKQLEGM